MHFSNALLINNLISNTNRFFKLKNETKGLKESAAPTSLDEPKIAKGVRNRSKWKINFLFFPNNNSMKSAEEKSKQL